MDLMDSHHRASQFAGKFAKITDDDVKVVIKRQAMREYELLNEQRASHLQLAALVAMEGFDAVMERLRDRLAFAYLQDRSILAQWKAQDTASRRIAPTARNGGTIGM